MRRRPMPPAEPPPRAGPGGEAMAEPAQSSAGGREGWRVLLARYAATPEAADARIRDLAGRIVDDMERALTFYRDTLGLPLFSPPDLPGKFLQVGEQGGPSGATGA